MVVEWPTLPKFKNYRLLREVAPGEIGPQYFEGLAGAPYEGTVVGKLRPWDDSDNEYVLYDDGDLMVAELESK